MNIGSNFKFNLTFGIRALFTSALHFRVYGFYWIWKTLDFIWLLNSFQSQFVLNHRKLIFGYVSVFRVKIGMKSKDLKLSFGWNSIKNFVFRLRIFWMQKMLNHIEKLLDSWFCVQNLIFRCYFGLKFSFSVSGFVDLQSGRSDPSRGWRWWVYFNQYCYYIFHLTQETS
jgi:hypothetical protein